MDVTSFDYNPRAAHGGPYAFLSNMWGSRPSEDGDITVTRASEHDRPYRFTCIESAFQGFKATLTDDPGLMREFEGVPGPRAKYLGGRRGILSLSPKALATWNGPMKLELMDRLVRLKFNQHPDLAERLREIDGRIVEGNSWGDTEWGVCRGVGENRLGKILMACRDELVATDSLSLAPTAAQGRERVEAVTRQKAKDAALDRQMRDCMPDKSVDPDDPPYA